MSTFARTTATQVTSTTPAKRPGEADPSDSGLKIASLSEHDRQFAAQIADLILATGKPLLQLVPGTLELRAKAEKELRRILESPEREERYGHLARFCEECASEFAELSKGAARLITAISPAADDPGGLGRVGDYRRLQEGDSPQFVRAIPLSRNARRETAEALAQSLIHDGAAGASFEFRFLADQFRPQGVVILAARAEGSLSAFNISVTESYCPSWGRLPFVAEVAEAEGRRKLIVHIHDDERLGKPDNHQLTAHFQFVGEEALRRGLQDLLGRLPESPQAFPHGSQSREYYTLRNRWSTAFGPEVTFGACQMYGID